MRTFIQRLSSVFAAVALAEEGDERTARELLAEAEAAPTRDRDAEPVALVDAIRQRPLAKTS